MRLQMSEDLTYSCCVTASSKTNRSLVGVTQDLPLPAMIIGTAILIILAWCSPSGAPLRHLELLIGVF